MVSLVENALHFPRLNRSKEGGTLFLVLNCLKVTWKSLVRVMRGAKSYYNHFDQDLNLQRCLEHIKLCMAMPKENYTNIELSKYI